MNIYISSWEELKSEIKGKLLVVTPIEFYVKLLEWAYSLKNSHDQHVRNLYNEYLEYYTQIDIDKYVFSELWYSFDGLIKYDYLNLNQAKLDILVVRCRDLLNEITVFKSDRECKLLGNDYLRVFTNKYSGELLFCCDTCSYIEDINGENVEIIPSLLPATAQQISENNIKPCSF